MDENCLSLEVAGKPDAEVTARWRSTTIRQAAPGSFFRFWGQSGKCWARGPELASFMFRWWIIILNLMLKYVKCYYSCLFYYNIKWEILTTIRSSFHVYFSNYSGSWFGTCFILPFSWEFHHPNWLSLTPSFFRGVGRKTTNVANNIDQYWGYSQH